jgi:hypothetical protein
VRARPCWTFDGRVTAEAGTAVLLVKVVDPELLLFIARVLLPGASLILESSANAAI